MTSQEFVEMEMGERELIVKYLRGLAELQMQQSGNMTTQLGRKLIRKALYDVANEIKQGAHMPKGEK